MERRTFIKKLEDLTTVNRLQRNGSLQRMISLYQTGNKKILKNLRNLIRTMAPLEIAERSLTHTNAPGLGITKRIGAYFETFDEVVKFSDWISEFDSCITYLIKDNMQPNISFGLGLNQEMNYF
jgi:hypothetical protein